MAEADHRGPAHSCLRRRGIRALDGFARVRTRGHDLGANPRRMRLLAGRLRSPAAADVGVCFRPRTDPCFVDVGDGWQGQKIQSQL